MDKDETRRVMAKRLNDLMADSSTLNTLKKVAAASGASYGTVKNIRTNSVISENLSVNSKILLDSKWQYLDTEHIAARHRAAKKTARSEP